MICMSPARTSFFLTRLSTISPSSSSSWMVSNRLSTRIHASRNPMTSTLSVPDIFSVRSQAWLTSLCRRSPAWMRSWNSWSCENWSSVMSWSLPASALNSSRSSASVSSSSSDRSMTSGCSSSCPSSWSMSTASGTRPSRSGAASSPRSCNPLRKSMSSCNDANKLSSLSGFPSAASSDTVSLTSSSSSLAPTIASSFFSAGRGDLSSALSASRLTTLERPYGWPLRLKGLLWTCSGKSDGGRMNAPADDRLKEAASHECSTINNGKIHICTSAPGTADHPAATEFCID
mmetsp:Transcript_4777/g.11060  ORF Transcript_4777/g.11060 Transcript_4777/m.11060 type:complete len:289 (-) Transcript_4777:39-905(-)